MDHSNQNTTGIKMLEKLLDYFEKDHSHTKSGYDILRAARKGLLTTKTKIVAVAIYSNGMIFTMPPPARHGHVLEKMSVDFGMDAIEHGIPENQGFLTSEGKFVNRQQAAQLVLHNGQLEKLNWPPDLYSEDLW